MFRLGQFKNWRKMLRLSLLLIVGSVVVPLATWWYAPVILWWFFRSLTNVFSGIWVVAVVVLVSLQMAVLWSLPVGLLVIVMTLVVWSLENIEKIRNDVMRWLLEILHGFLITVLVLLLSQSFHIEWVLFNCLAVVAYMAVMIVMSQMYEK